MHPWTCLSSHRYPFEIADVLVLPDTPNARPVKGENVIVFLGDKAKNIPDTLYQGRGYLEHLLRQGETHAPVAVAFKRNRPWFDVLAPFCKVWRNRFCSYNTNKYHLDPLFIRENGLERGQRNKNNAYRYSKWKLSREQRDKQYNELHDSLQNGYDDNYPMEVMVCRSAGARDTLHQGHHRMMFCTEMNIHRACITFRYVSHAPRWMIPAIRFVMNIGKKKKS